MTPADAIAILDAEIANIKAKINSAPLYYNNSPIRDYIENPGNRLKRDVIKSLQKIGGRESTLQSIASVSFESRFSGYFAYQAYGQRETEAGLERCFQEGINAITTILQQEREHFIRIKQEQESAIQKRYNRISLIISITAIILSAISLGFTIFS